MEMLPLDIGRLLLSYLNAYHISCTAATCHTLRRWVKQSPLIYEKAICDLHMPIIANNRWPRDVSLPGRILRKTKLVGVSHAAFYRVCCAFSDLYWYVPHEIHIHTRQHLAIAIKAAAHDSEMTLIVHFKLPLVGTRPPYTLVAEVDDVTIYPMDKIILEYIRLRGSIEDMVASMMGEPSLAVVDYIGE